MSQYTDYPEKKVPRSYLLMSLLGSDNENAVVSTPTE